MKPIPGFSVIFVLALLTGGGGNAVLLGGLAERSPFLPPGFVPPEERTQAAPPPAGTQGPLSRRFEFRGVYELAGEYRFLITDRRTREGKWVPLNDSSAPFHVRSFDLANNSIVLNHEGQTETIELERLGANSTPMPVAGAPSPTATRPPVATAQPGQPRAAQPPERTRRPTVRPAGAAGTASPPPPPQWLQERREAAARARAQNANAPSSPPSSDGPRNVDLPPPPGFSPSQPANMPRPPPPPAFPD